MKKNILIFILVVIVLVGGFYLYKNKKTPVVEEIKTETVSHDFVFEKKKIQEGGEDKIEEINVEYPFITNASTPAEEKINSQISEFINSTISDTKKDFKEFRDDPYLKDSATPLSLSIIYKINKNTNLDVTNVLFEIYTYSGGAHGITGIKYFVFDNKTGEVISLKDVFENSDYLELLSKLSILEIERIDPGLKTYTGAEEGTAPKKDNFQNFALEDSGFKLKFSDYQIGPYVVGRLEIIIPYEKLSENLQARFKLN